MVTCVQAYGGLLLVVGCLVGCVRQELLPPALPEEVWHDTLPAEMPYQDRWIPDTVAETPRPASAPAPVVAADPRPAVEVAAIEPGPKPPPKPAKVETPSAIVKEANRQATVTPQRAGYFGNRAEQRYVYEPGKIYLILCAPEYPCTILLPPGEQLMATPVLKACAPPQQSAQPAEPTDDKCWVVGGGVTSDEEQPQSVLVLHPMSAGMESMMPLITKSGRAYYCLLRSQATMGMVSVTWELPTLTPVQGAGPAPRRNGQGHQSRTEMEPTISLDRLHTAYTIVVTSKQRPPWVPVQVFDDGTWTYIRFKEALDFTTSPAVFRVRPGGEAGPVEFVTQHSPHGGLTYVVQGLYPRLLLRGPDEQQVTITRGPNASGS